MDEPKAGIMKFGCLPSFIGRSGSFEVKQIPELGIRGSFKSKVESNGIIINGIIENIDRITPPELPFEKCKPKPRIAIVGDPSNDLATSEIPVYRKNSREEDFIRSAIMSNEFLNNLEPSQIDMVVKAMYHQEIPRDTFIITEGEQGYHLYVSGDGEFKVLKRGQVINTLGPGRVFGELAILYNAQRNASIQAVTDAMVWVLDRKIFKQIMMVTGIKRMKDNINYLRTVPLLEQLSEEQLGEMADLLKVKFFAPGVHIVEQDTHGDEFFIISGGSVKISKRNPGSAEEEDVGTLIRGDFFGEQALLHQVLRQATITALPPGVECLVLERGPFEKYLGGIEGLKIKKYPQTIAPASAGEVYQDINLKDLEVVGTLGVGGFGRVELVQYKRNKKLTFALKRLKKHYVVEQQQQEHTYNEKRVMLECTDCPFITRLYRTYRDKHYVYFLMEPCLGGDIFTVLQKYHRFEEVATRFMAGCVVEALDFLHKRGFIYRDLKPENLLLDARGYIKVTDFGFAKRIGTSGKTWTFAGTPEYVAPEIILAKGHDRAVDYWALGVLIYELLSGGPPFRGNDHMKTYNQILKGIESVTFSSFISRDAKGLIKKLCRVVPSERLGYQRNGVNDIRKHKWFDGFNWEGLKQRTLQAPIVRPVKSDTDLSNFDKYEKDREMPPDENSGWDKDF